MEQPKKNYRAVRPFYSDETKKKCVEFALKGMTVEEIVKAIKGPKTRAVMRYLRHAEVPIKR